MYATVWFDFGTNKLAVAGPYKTQDDAIAKANQLMKQGEWIVTVVKLTPP